MDTVTSATLLEAIKDGQDGQAWGLFITRYRPMIVSFAIRAGLDSSEAQDVAQETLLAFLQNYRDGQYDRLKGRFRSWLFGIAHSKAVDIQRRKVWEDVVPSDSQPTGILTRIESPNEMKELWEEEWQRWVLRMSLEEVARDVKPQTLSAFDLYVFKKWPAEKIARHLEISENSVYLAKNRVLKLLRKVKERIEKTW